MTACEICKGACCESAVIRFEDSGEAKWHANLRGLSIDEYHVEFEVPCRKLSSDGFCTIHPDRPDTCRNYEVGGALCIDTVRRRRGVEIYNEILLAIQDGRV
jgi:Fe-S-cluster containining protein